MSRRHQHDHAHGSIRLARTNASVHRLGRRSFLTELGRRGLAVAILGGAVASCSDADDAAGTTDVRRPDTTARPDTVPTPATTPGTTSDDAPTVELAWTQVSFGFVSAYVLTRGNAAAVVDTGTAGSADQIGETLAALGLTFDDVEHVVLTHHHPDHVGSLPEVMQRAVDATAYAGELDIPSITGAELTAVADGDDVFGLQVIDTPGHTPGSISLFDPGIGLLVAGDALNGTDDGTAVLGPNEEFTADMATANESVAKLAGFDVEAVAFGHGQPVPEGAGPLLDALV